MRQRRFVQRAARPRQHVDLVERDGAAFRLVELGNAPVAVAAAHVAHQLVLRRVGDRARHVRQRQLVARRALAGRQPVDVGDQRARRQQHAARPDRRRLPAQAGAPVRLHAGLLARPALGNVAQQAVSALSGRRRRRAAPHAGQHLLQRLVDVVRRRQPDDVLAQAPHRRRVARGERRREAQAEVRHALLVLALDGAPHGGVARPVVGEHHEHRVVELPPPLHRLEVREQLGVGELRHRVAVVAVLAVEHEAELRRALVHVEQVGGPAQQVRVARLRAETVRPVGPPLLLDARVERPHVVVDRLPLEAEHAVREGAEVDRVLAVLRHVAALLRRLPDPRMVVDRLRVLVPPPCLGKLLLVLARQHRQQRLRRAVAHDVVALQHRPAENAHEVIVRLRQVLYPREARHRVVTDHQDVQRRGGTRRRRQKHALHMSDARVEVRVPSTVCRPTLGVEEIANERQFVGDVFDRRAVERFKIVDAAYDRGDSTRGLRRLRLGGQVERAVAHLHPVGLGLVAGERGVRQGARPHLQQRVDAPLTALVTHAEDKRLVAELGLQEGEDGRQDDDEGEEENDDACPLPATWPHQPAEDTQTVKSHHRLITPTD